MKVTGDGVNKAVKIIVGALLIIVGCLFVARPVISTAVAVDIAGWMLIVMGALELILFLIPKCRMGKRPASAITAIFKLFMGILILFADAAIVLLLPVIFAVWLAMFGVYRIILGSRRRKEGADNWATSTSIGVIAIAGAVMVAIINWVAAMDMIGVLIAVLAILYGFVLLMDAFVRSAQKSVEEIMQEDAEISQAQNEKFYEFEEKLKK